MKIGEAIQSLDRSDDESARILESVTNGVGKPFEIYNVYASKSKNTPMWRQAQKTLKITGFRPGKGKNTIISRVNSGLKSNNHMAINAFWMIYYDCVVSYLNQESPMLNQLLLERELEGDPDSTIAIFKSISKYSILYEVDVYQAEVLYEIWWFDRVPNVDELFFEGVLSTGVVKELIASVESKNRKAFDKLRDKTERLESAIADIKRNNTSNLEVSKLKDYFESITDEMKLEAAKLEKDIAVQFESRISSLEGKMVSGLKRSEKKDIEDKFVLYRKNIESLNHKIVALEKKKEEIRVGRRASILRDIDGFNSRVSKLINETPRSFNAATLIQSILGMQGAFYIGSEVLFNAICYESIESSTMKEIVFSPSRYEFSDEEFDSFLNFEVLFLRNISSTFVEGAVLPILIMAGSPYKHFPKVFVEFDGHLNSSIQALVRTHSIDINIEFINAIKEIEVPSGKIFDVAFETLNEVSDIHREFRLFLSNSDVNLNTFVFERFVRLVNILKQCTEIEKAVFLSSRLVVMPFVKSAFGETKCQVITELLNGFITQY